MSPANTNKKEGNDFEREFCKMLADNGIWALNISQGRSGQPADIIGVTRGEVNEDRACLIDCKVISTDRGFDGRRVEPNQVLAMQAWDSKCFGYSGFAFKLPDGSVWLLPWSYVEKYVDPVPKTISEKKIRTYGESFERWVYLCM